MTVALQRSETLPCQRDPERWFDRSRHTAALAGCRRCPSRRWCAREALQSAASYGVWAGIWIDGRHEDAAAHLRAVADGTLAQSAAMAAARVAESEHAMAPNGHRHSPAAEPLSRRRRSSRPTSVATAILARSSGHCEVLADGCWYSYDRLVSRHRAGARCDQTVSPSTVFAACRSCADTVAALSCDRAAELGYLVNGRRNPAKAPFLWRSSRWVLLDGDGLTELRDQPDRIAV